MATLREPDAEKSRTDDLAQRVRLLEQRLAVEHAIARLLAETPRLEDAAPPLLAAIAELVRADLGELWTVNGEVLQAFAVWTRDPARFGAFVRDSLARRFRRGVGLPGRVWHDGTAAIIPRLIEDDNFPRQAAAAAVGLSAGVAMPVAARGDFLGVMEFFSEVPMTVDTEMLHTLTAIGHEVAQAVRLQQQLLELENASREKDAFLATLSHELRTPMNAILGWLRMLTSGAVAAEDWRRAIAAVERNARVQARLIDDLLDISRVVSGRLEIEREPVDLNVLVGSAVEGLRPSVDSRGLRLRIDVPAAPLTVVGDARRLMQVTLNLVNNAIKFSHGGGEVRVRLEEQGGAAALTVSDMGIGIDPGFLPHLFERFRQADASHAREHGGLGLGLAIARHLVELHGGIIRAHSDGLGRGATFTVRLPLR